MTELVRMDPFAGSAEDEPMEIWVLPAVTAAFLVLFFAMRNERVRRLLACPIKNTTAEVEIVQRYRHPEKAVRVTRCSLLADPSKVTCGQDCIHQHA